MGWQSHKKSIRLTYNVSNRIMISYKMRKIIHTVVKIGYTVPKDQKDHLMTSS